MAGAVTFKLSEDDVVHGNRLFALASARRPRTIIILIVLFIAILSGMSMIAGVIFPFDMERLARSWPLVLGTTLAPFLVVLLLNVFVNPLLARRMYRQQRSLQGQLSLTWTDERLEFDTEYGQFAMPWSHFVHWAEDRRTFILFESDRLYRIIPKRALGTDAERDLRERLASIGA